MVIAGFSVTPQDSGVFVAWETANEIGLLGFNLLRTRADGAANRPASQPVVANAELVYNFWSGCER